MIDNHPLKSHCAQYILPVGLVFGRVVIDDILFNRSRHPEVARLGAGMTLVHDPALNAEYPARYTSVVELHLKDGRMLSRRVASAKGTPEHPLTSDEICAKFRRLTDRVIPAARAEAIVAFVDRIDRAPDLSRLGAVLRAKTGGRRSSPPSSPARRGRGSERG